MTSQNLYFAAQFNFRWGDMVAEFLAREIHFNVYFALMFLCAEPLLLIWCSLRSEFAFSSSLIESVTQTTVLMCVVTWYRTWNTAGVLHGRVICLVGHVSERWLVWILMGLDLIWSTDRGPEQNQHSNDWIEVSGQTYQLCAVMLLRSASWLLYRPCRHVSKRRQYRTNNRACLGLNTFFSLSQSPRCFAKILFSVIELKCHWAYVSAVLFCYCKSISRSFYLPC